MCITKTNSLTACITVYIIMTNEQTIKIVNYEKITKSSKITFYNLNKLAW